MNKVHQIFMQKNLRFDQFPADFVPFTVEILNGKLHFFVQCFDQIKSQIFLHKYLMNLIPVGLL